MKDNLGMKTTGLLFGALLACANCLGVTGSVTISRHQSIKLSYNRGAYVRFGGSFDYLTMAWQYSWFGRPN